MRLALYHPWIYLHGGIERLILELVRRSRHHWTVYTHHFDPDRTFVELRGLPVVELEPRVSVERSFRPLLRAAATIAGTRLPADGSKSLLVSSEGLGDLVLLRNRLPAACYCHTPLKILHDERARADLRRRSRRQAAALEVLGPLWNRIDRQLWHRYRHAFTNSQETRGRLERARLVPGGPLEVLHPGVDVDRFTLEGGPERERVFLVPGRIMWQKGVELAVEAFKRARRRGLDARLVVAGTVDRKSEPYLAELRRLAADEPVAFEIAPPDERLAELYRTALAVVFPAPNEDFGIVPLEAMASGAPVLAVDSGGPRETIVDGTTGWLLPPDPGAFAERMLRVATAGEELAAVRRQARRRAEDFSWDRLAGRVDEVMEAIASEESG